METSPPAAGPPPRPSRLRRALVILCLVPIAFVLSPLILFVAVCAVLVRK